MVNVCAWRTAQSAYWFFFHLYTFDVGRGQVIGRFTTLIPDIGVLFIFLDYFDFIKITKTGIVLSICIGIVLVYMLGYYYMKWNLDKVNHIISGKRQYLLNSIYEKVIEGKKREEL